MSFFKSFSMKKAWEQSENKDQQQHVCYLWPTFFALFTESLQMLSGIFLTSSILQQALFSKAFYSNRLFRIKSAFSRWKKRRPR